jgi:PEP-CTERM motif
MRSLKLFIFSIVAAYLFVCSQAIASVVATTYDFTYDGKLFDLAGQFVVENAVAKHSGVLGDGYKIDSLTGTYTFSAFGAVKTGELTGLTLFPCLGCGKTDNILYLDGPLFVDNQGIGITTDSVLSFKLFSDKTDPLRVAVFGVALFDDPGTLTISAAVPEPSTWAMLILGFIGIGVMAYRRQRPDKNEPKHTALHAVA